MIHVFFLVYSHLILHFTYIFSWLTQSTHLFGEIKKTNSLHKIKYLPIATTTFQSSIIKKNSLETSNATTNVVKISMRFHKWWGLFYLKLTRRGGTPPSFCNWEQIVLKHQHCLVSEFFRGSKNKKCSTSPT